MRKLLLLIAGLVLPVAAWAQPFRPPQPIKMDPPVYPFELSQKSIGGQVEVEFVITSAGTTVNHRVLRSTHSGFNAAALEAVRKWTYRPGSNEGRLVNVKVSQRLEFFLEADQVYPFELLLSRVNGQATVDYVVDELGRAWDIRVIEATRPEFGLALSANVTGTNHAPDFDKSETTGVRRKVTRRFVAEGKESPIGPAAQTLLKALRAGGAQFNDKEFSTVVKGAFDETYPFPTGTGVALGTEGWARVEFYLDSKGKCWFPHVLAESHPGLGYMAVQAVQSKNFHPQKLKGAVAIRSQVTIKFSAMTR
ncbi:energy transducer TonB [Oleiharenicola lentus]|uniref:energy transducer TonB n=1 Tax=Oleiharenicola lentus TaxID=2508720 RepID=UPI003F66A5A2